MKKELCVRLVIYKDYAYNVNFNVTLHVSGSGVNPLNAELNPICHLLVLLGDLTFMSPCIVSIFQYISNKKQRYTVYLYLETTAHSNRIQLFHDSAR